MPLRFSLYFTPGYGLQPYVPEFEPVMVNLQQLNDDALGTGVLVGAALKTLKYSLGNLRPYLVSILRAVSSLPMDGKNRAL